MPANLLFLSHIHEERNLALIIKNAIEAEFGGFVDVFVSSDGSSIPAGANFLKRIEDALVGCIGALYLISPTSVKRPWINFELGAVWIRGTCSLQQSKPEIPALPICHSGMNLSNLPAPINNLNAIQGSQPTSLEFAFKSIQAAVGGRGALRTNFDALAGQVIDFELEYTLGSDLKNLLIKLGIKPKEFARFAKTATSPRINVDLGQVLQDPAIELIDFIESRLSGLASYDTKLSGTSFGPKGPTNFVEISFEINAALIIKLAAILEA